jgi:hypothetical protein
VRLREHGCGRFLGGRRLGPPLQQGLCLDELEKRHAAPHQDVWETRDFNCRQLGPDVYLLTYTLIQDAVRLTRRATIWQRTDAGWKIVYHQGTIVESP